MPGLLIVKGCVVHALNGAPKNLFLPVSTETEEEHQSRRQSMMICENERTKYSGLDSRPWDKGGKRLTSFLVPPKLKPRFLECTVVSEQPLLRLRWTSVTHAAVMLYNGEKCVTEHGVLLFFSFLFPGLSFDSRLKTSPLCQLTFWHCHLRIPQLLLHKRRWLKDDSTFLRCTKPNTTLFINEHSHGTETRRSRLLIQVRKLWYPLRALERLNGMSTSNLYVQNFMHSL